MINPPEYIINQWVSEARQAAANPEHEWDRKAIDWPQLDETAVVFEVGSFKGRWALQICEKYNPFMYCFEPQEWACRVTRDVLKNFNARMFNFGLGASNAMAPMAEFGTDGAKIAPDGVEGEYIISIRDISQVLIQIGVGINEIDLMLVNIEGGEYELLPYMFRQEIFPEVLMVQFHGEPYDALRKKIEREYDILWDYGRTLTAFVRKAEEDRPLVKGKFLR